MAFEFEETQNAPNQPEALALILKEAKKNEVPPLALEALDDMRALNPDVGERTGEYGGMWSIKGVGKEDISVVHVASPKKVTFKPDPKKNGEPRTNGIPNEEQQESNSRTYFVDVKDGLLTEGEMAYAVPGGEDATGKRLPYVISIEKALDETGLVSPDQGAVIRLLRAMDMMATRIYNKRLVEGNMTTEILPAWKELELLGEVKKVPVMVMGKRVMWYQFTG